MKFYSFAVILMPSFIFMIEFFADEQFARFNHAHGKRMRANAG